MSAGRWGWCVALLAGAAWGQERPNEDAMFGGPEATATDAGMPAGRDEGAMFGGGDAPSADAGRIVPDLPSTATSRDEAQLGGPALQSRFDTKESESDPLRIGGTLYMRGLATWLDQRPPRFWSFQVPSLLDAYLDARPNDSVRAFALGRLRYDPTQSAAPSFNLGPTAPGAVVATNPSVALDQLWLRFDVKKQVFFTVGRQKVKWGTGRLWQPTDFLNATRRDPLLPFDLRLGVNAVKVHVPIESLGWNFYGFGLLDNDAPDTNPSQLGKVSGALRAEFVFKQTEIGLDGVWALGRRPRYGVDVSSALGPVDVYVDVAFRDGRDFTVWKEAANVDPSTPLAGRFEATTLEGIQAQVTAGLAWQVNYTDNNMLVVGGEYFYNPAGYDSATLYPWLAFSNQLQFFYTGRHYAGVFVSAPGLPDLPWVTLSLNGLMNLSDVSGTVRMDAFFRVLTFLQLEVFVAANFGAPGGEFRFGLDLPPFPLGDGTSTPAVKVAPPNGSAGVGLRLSL